MFTNILIPIDGSELSERAVRSGVQFAKSIGARITAFHATPKVQALSYSAKTFGDEREESVTLASTRADSLLRFVRKAASAAGVPCDVASASSDAPYEEIIKAAEGAGCDLILMASHGRRGIERVLLGSQTDKVLTHSHIPVLVYR